MIGLGGLLRNHSNSVHNKPETIPTHVRVSGRVEERQVFKRKTFMYQVLYSGIGARRVFTPWQWKEFRTAPGSTGKGDEVTEPRRKDSSIKYTCQLDDLLEADTL